MWNTFTMNTISNCIISASTSVLVSYSCHGEQLQRENSDNIHSAFFSKIFFVLCVKQESLLDALLPILFHSDVTQFVLSPNAKVPSSHEWYAYSPCAASGIRRKMINWKLLDAKQILKVTRDIQLPIQERKTSQSRFTPTLLQPLAVGLADGRGS